MNADSIVRGVVGACACLVSLSALAQPTVHRVDGTLAAGTSVTIVGSGFGATGPKVVLYDDFEASSPLVGQWSGGGRVLVSGGYSSGRAHQAFNPETGTTNILKTIFGQHDEILLSYRVRIPQGGLFPGNATQEGTFSTNSSWKLTWLFYTEQGYRNDGNFDLCLPTYFGSSFSLSGNDFNYEHVSTSWWSWSTWNQVTVHLQNDATSPGFFRTVSEEKGWSSHRLSSGTPFPPEVSQYFDRLNVPGWIRSDSNSRPLYDDVYVAVGSGSQARVELADAPRLADARSVTILPVESWSNQQIVARVPRDVPSSARYVFVVTADGQVNAMGVFSTCDDCPEPPAVLQVE